MAKPQNKTAANKPAARKSKDLDLSDLYDSADPAEAMAGMPVGEWECDLTGSGVEKDGKKTSVYLQWTGRDGEAEGKQGRMFYGIVDDSGNPGKGIGYLKRDLSTLDVEKDENESFEDFIENLTSLGLAGIIKVKQNGEYTNLYLQGAAMPASPDPDEKPPKSKSKGKSKTDEDDNDDDDEVVDVGDEVKGTNIEGDDVSGEITKIKGDFVFVKDSDDEIHKCKAEDVNKPKPKAKAKAGKAKPKADPEVGDEVTWTDDDGDDKEGTINKIKGTVAFVEDDDGSIERVELSELTVK